MHRQQRTLFQTRLSQVVKPQPNSTLVPHTLNGTGLSAKVVRLPAAPYIGSFNHKYPHEGHWVRTWGNLGSGLSPASLTSLTFLSIVFPVMRASFQLVFTPAKTSAYRYFIRHIGSGTGIWDLPRSRSGQFRGSSACPSESRARACAGYPIFKPYLIWVDRWGCQS